MGSRNNNPISPQKNLWLAGPRNPTTKDAGRILGDQNVHSKFTPPQGKMPKKKKKKKSYHD